MNKKKIIKLIAFIAFTGLIIAGGIGLYMFNMPHRDVLTTDSDYSITASELTKEYLVNKNMANEKYLSDDGDSKILKITGTISKISTDYNGNLVILLKEGNDKAGVNCSFPIALSKNPEIGSTITIKGVIRSGATYDEDLEMYENVIIEKSTLVSDPSTPLRNQL